MLWPCCVRRSAQTLDLMNFRYIVDDPTRNIVQFDFISVCQKPTLNFPGQVAGNYAPNVENRPIFPFTTNEATGHSA